MSDPPTTLTAVRLAGYDQFVYLPYERAELRRLVNGAAPTHGWLLDCPLWVAIGNDLSIFFPAGKADVNLRGVGTLSGPVKVRSHEMERLAASGYLQIDKETDGT